MIVTRGIARIAGHGQLRHLPRPREPRLHRGIDDHVAIERERAALAAQLERETAVDAQELDVRLARELLQRLRFLVALFCGS